MRKYSRVWDWFVLFVVMNIIDYHLTDAVIKSGIGIEGNPIMCWVIKQMGIQGILLVKMIFCGCLAVAIRVIIDHCSLKKLESITVIVRGVAIGQTIIVIWNLLIILRVI